MILNRSKIRRGLTLVEMLVVVGLTVLMMTIIAQIFGATTTSFQVARAIQEIDQELRAVEGTIKRDLAGATARMTPPLNPKDNQGYFEIGENEFADAQGEDSDDYMALTTRSTDGNLFLGRYLPPPSSTSGSPPFSPGPDARGANAFVAPTIITSDTAEVIYFLRNHNLYRRVFLVKPGLRLNHEYAFTTTGVYQGVQVANLPGVSGRVGWQALNDISMRPGERISSPLPGRPGSLPAPGQQVFDTYIVVGGVLTKFESEVRPIANTLGDLTNRQNRAFRPRFTNDYLTPVYDATGALTGVLQFPDGQPDDFIGAAAATAGSYRNEIDDYTPATYPNLVNTMRTITGFGVAVNEALPPTGFNYYPVGVGQTDTLSFPFVYPHAYSRFANGSLAQLANIPAQGAIHGLALEATARSLSGSDPWLPYWNHNPLDQGDNLPVPGADTYGNMLAGQTWWGFPTWREQLSPLWIDPLKRLAAPFGMTGLTDAPTVAMLRGHQPYGLSWSTQLNQFGWLPEMVSPTRTRDQLFSENGSAILSGSSSRFYSNMSTFWYTTWEDDLLATNVRSFDIKVFEPLPEIQSYVDLGYMATPTAGSTIVGGRPVSPAMPIDFIISGSPTTVSISSATTIESDLLGFGHEGRMPPLTTDYRTDAQFPFIPGIGPRFLGDDTAGIVRLRRVWDTWSTDYSAVDAKTMDPLTAPPFQVAPRPSYPAPYPAPLRGIQIQIRMTDPRDERIRTITIHQDFSSKL
jgi:type II secretory pathway component PulJ